MQNRTCYQIRDSAQHSNYFLVVLLFFLVNSCLLYWETWNHDLVNACLMKVGEFNTMPDILCVCGCMHRHLKYHCHWWELVAGFVNMFIVITVFRL